ncbi:uncharacterized protein [Enoplosus armatus]|uniref:uncharacterized protein n=1 Tax=Enoplosus armatus TaxID=215367 RepID=UPI0039969C5C
MVNQSEYKHFKYKELIKHGIQVNQSDIGVLCCRENLQKALRCYVTDTLSHIDTVIRFCERISRWMGARTKELTKINQKEINQKKLAAVLKVTVSGLEKLDHFLDAVEKLAVTSLHVFVEENQVLHLPQGISLEHVQVVITAARLICPLLLEFKRDASVFFLPKLQNVEVLSYQLDKYIQTTQNICEKLQKSSLGDFCLKMNNETVVHLDVDLSVDDIQMMLYHINQLDKIRKNRNFRMVFLFQEESCSRFTSEFSERQPRMLQFLNDLEQSAVKLDRMNKGAKISSVAGSSVGLVGGALSIAGLLLIPVTAGASLGLMIGGSAMGITSGVNSAVTTTTEILVNRKHQNKANAVFQSFMEDVESLQGCLEEVTSQPVTKIEVSDIYVAADKVGKNVVAVGKGIASIADAAKALKNEKLIRSAGRVAGQEGKALRNVSKMASDIPDIGQAAVKGPLALSKSARAGLIAVNALFMGMDVFFICKDSISLAKGSETEVSQFIRARGALWRSELDSWQKIHDSLCKGLLTSEKNKAILETPFYPEVKERMCCVIL